MTLRDLFREFVVARRLFVQRHDAAVWQAWHGALFTRWTKLESPDRFLLSKRAIGGRRQTADEMLPLLHMMANTFGVPVMRGGKQVVM